jgi:hypothetical protein
MLRGHQGEMVARAGLKIDRSSKNHGAGVPSGTDSAWDFLLASLGNGGGVIGRMYTRPPSFPPPRHREPSRSFRLRDFLKFFRLRYCL